MACLVILFSRSSVTWGATNNKAPPPGGALLLVAYVDWTRASNKDGDGSPLHRSSEGATVGIQLACLARPELVGGGFVTSYPSG